MQRMQSAYMSLKLRMRPRLEVQMWGARPEVRTEASGLGSWPILCACCEWAASDYKSWSWPGEG